MLHHPAHYGGGLRGEERRDFGNFHPDISRIHLPIALALGDPNLALSTNYLKVREATIKFEDAQAREMPGDNVVSTYHQHHDHDDL